MSQNQDRQINQSPAVSLDSADYLTNKKVLKEYDQIQSEHLCPPSLLGRFASRPGVRRFARDLVRIFMILIAVGITAALIYFLEQDASLATGE